MFAFCTFQANCVLRSVPISVGYYRIIQSVWWHREVEKMASQVIVPEVFWLESIVCGHHIYKWVWTPVVGEKLPVDIEEDNTNDPRVVAVGKLLSAMYQEIVCWFQVS